MAKSPRQIVIELVDKLAPKVRDAFLLAIADIRDDVSLNDLIKAIEANNYQRAFSILGLSQAAMRPLTLILEQVFEQAGTAVGNTFPKSLINTDGFRTVFHFDVRNPRAERWLRDQSSSLITRIQEDTRVNVMNIMTRNLEVGNNPRTTALDIVGRIDPKTQRRTGGIIGLTEQQELWVANARRDLQNLDANYLMRERRDKRFDSIVRRAIAEKKPLGQDVISKLLSRYKDNLLVLRGETISRTETIQGLNRAEFESYKQAIDMGVTKSGDVEKIWDNAGDGRVRHDHRLMEGQTVGIDEPFVFPDGTKAMFPGDASLGASAKEIINCRCKTRFNVDWLADLD